MTTRPLDFLRAALPVGALVFALAAPAPLAIEAARPVAPAGAAEDLLPALPEIPPFDQALIDRWVEEWVRIAEIPAPSGFEDRRAAYLRERFVALGLSGVRRDSLGNVIGLLEGRDRRRPKVAFLAHMDTVAPETSDHSVRRLGEDRLQAPGIRDDSSGLAGMLAALDLMRTHGLRPAADTWFVATVREEVGLIGAEGFVAAHAQDLGAVIAVDGHLGQISHAATGIVWLKIHFTSAGAHTLRAHDEPNAILAAARAIERISALHVRRTPEEMETWLNIGMIGGGDVPNAQARDVWFTVDLRSNDPASLEKIERQVRRIARSTAEEIGVRFEEEVMHRMPGGRIPGSEDSRLVQAARRVLEHLGWQPIEITMRGTADHNVAIRRRIPAIAVGMTTGGGAHTPAEYADIAPFATGVRQILLLSLAPLTVPEAAPTGAQ